MALFFVQGCLLLDTQAQDPTPAPAAAPKQEPPAAPVAPVMPQKKLGPGDNAPALTVGKWLKGEPLKELTKDRVHVVEFWATWCGPCRATIPHLDGLHRAYDAKGVTFIGQNCFEEDSAKVEHFITEMGEKMSYRVALDDASQIEGGAMAKNWMSAAGQNSIPCAFVVGKDGKIAWIGHPAKLSDKMLDEVLAGTFKPEPINIAGLGPEEDKTNYGALHMAVGEAVKQGKWEEAAEAMKKLKAAMPKEELGMLGLMELDVALANAKTDDVSRVAGELVAANEKDVALLHQVAFRMASKSSDVNLLAMAWGITEKALSQAPDAAKNLIHFTQSKILFAQGKQREATQLLEAMMPNAPERLRPHIQDAIKAYSENKPKSE